MNRFKNKFLSVMLSAAMVAGMLSPMGVQASVMNSGDEYLKAADGKNVKVTVTYGGAESQFGVVEGNIASVVDGDTSTGVTFRGSASSYEGDGIVNGDYIQADYEEAFTLENAVFTFKSSDNKFQNSTFSYSLDGNEWVEAGTIEGSAVMIYEADAAIEGVKAIRLTNNADVKKWVELAEISVNQDLPYIWNSTESKLGYEKVSGTATAPSAASEELEGAGNGIVAAATDESKNTFWHSSYSNDETDLRNGGGTATSEYSYIEVALAEATDLAGVTYMPRQLSAYDYSNGAFKTFKVQVKTADGEWTDADVANINGNEVMTADFVGTDLEGNEVTAEGPYVTVDYAERKPNEELEVFFKDVQKKITAVKFVVKESFGTSNTQYNMFLNTAEIAGLKAKEPVVVVDKTALEEAIATAEALVEADYTAESWAGVQTALAAAKALAEDATQEMVDAAAADLNAAVEALEEVPEVEPTVDITTGMIAYYNFDDVEADATSVKNIVNADTYEAALLGGAFTEENAKYGQALKLAGGDENGLSIPSIMNTGTNSYSISMWYKQDAADKMILAQQDGARRTLLLVYQDGHYTTNVNGTEIGGTSTRTGTEWQHVTWVYEVDAENNSSSSTFYANGELDVTVDSRSEANWDALTNLLIGRHKNPGGTSFVGLLDEIRIYEGAVTAEQAKAIYEYSVEPEVEPADKSKLEGLVSDAMTDFSDYTEESAKAYQDALAAAEAVLAKEDATQEEVDNAYAALAAAVAALEKKPVVVPVNKSGLETMVADAKAGDYSSKTEESVAVLNAAIAAAEAVLADTEATQEAVDNAKAALVAAMLGLQDKPVVPDVDPADDSKDIPVDMYTATAGSTQPGNSPDTALDENPGSFWEVVWDIGNTDPSVMWYQIELADEVEIDAVRYLPRWGGDAGNINGFVTQYLIQVSTDGENWTDAAEGAWERTEGWKIAEFEAVTAKYVRLTGVGTWSDVGENSNMSIAEIRVRATGEVINKGALKAAIAKAEGLVEEDYVDISGIAAPLAAAKAVAEDKEATQEAVDAAAAALNEALGALVKVVKKDELKAAIADAKEVDQSLYTSASVKALVNAIEAGENLVEDANATQEVVDAATAGIAKAKASLVAKATAEEKAVLEAAVTEAEAIDTGAYTEESAAALADAIAEAKAVLENADATAKDVTNAAKELQTAVDALEIPVVEEVVRLFGDSRYDTGYAVADALKEALGVEKFQAVVVATGTNFADALAGSYLAVEKSAPILLTNGKDANVAQLHAYIKENVAEGGKVYILGGEGAVSVAVDTIKGYDVVRLFGDSRYDTNLEILKEAGVKGDSIIVATGKTFADSLSASAAKLPILLVKPNEALSDAQKEILAGMKNIYIVGGEGAVSADYKAELKAFGEVTRVFGNSRYDTSVEVAKAFCKDVDFAVVASGKNFPDGLCGGPLAAALNAPLVLTKDGGASAAAAYVAENGIVSGFVLGGDGALANETVVEVFALESAAEIK